MVGERLVNGWYCSCLWCSQLLGHRRACWGNKGQLQNHLLTGFLQFACYDQQLVCCVDDFCMSPMAAWKRWQVVWPTLDCELAAVVRFKLHELAWFDMVWNCFCLPMDCDFNMMSISNISSRMVVVWGRALRLVVVSVVSKLREKQNDTDLVWST